jgi:hypothetical protein
MSERLTLQDILRDYGVPLIKLDIHADRDECVKLRERLMDIVRVSGGKEQGYVELNYQVFIDVHDIDRYLSGELDSLGEMYAFPENINSYQEED